MRKVLVTGAAGLLGRSLVDRLKDRYSVLAVDIASNPFGQSENIEYYNADLTNFEKYGPRLEKFKPEFIFNCAAYTDVDGCERNHDLADALNVDLLEELLTISRGKIVQFSSDYVFDGKNGPYAETDRVNPICYYGITKLKSEYILQNSAGKYLVIRSNVLYGTASNVRPNFVTWLIDSLRGGQKLKIVTDQYNNPIHVSNLAEAAVEAVECDISGTLHIGGSEYLSRYDLALKTAEYFHLDTSLITPVSTAELGQTADRPLKNGLKIDKAERLLKTRFLGIDDGLRLMGNY